MRNESGAPGCFSLTSSEGVNEVHNIFLCDVPQIRIARGQMHVSVGPPAHTVLFRRPL